VHALVADVAVAGVPEPVPVVREAVHRERPHRRRSEKRIPIDAGRNRCHRRPANRFPALVAQPLGHVELADHPLAQKLNRFLLVRDRPALHPHLHHAPILGRGLDHLLAFKRIVAGRLLDIDILASLAGPDHGQRVPVIWRHDCDSVDVLAREQLAHLNELGRRVALPRFHQRRTALARRLVHVADRGDAALGQIGVAAHKGPPAPPKTNHPDVHPVVGARHAPGRDRRRRARKKPPSAE